MAKQTIVGQYLIHRLGELGLRRVFGIAGDYVPQTYGMLSRSKLSVVGA